MPLPAMDLPNNFRPPSTDPTSRNSRLQPLPASRLWADSQPQVENISLPSHSIPKSKPDASPYTVSHSTPDEKNRTNFRISASLGDFSRIFSTFGDPPTPSKPQDTPQTKDSKTMCPAYTGTLCNSSHGVYAALGAVGALGYPYGAQQGGYYDQLQRQFQFLSVCPQNNDTTGTTFESDPESPSDYETPPTSPSPPLSRDSPAKGKGRTVLHYQVHPNGPIHAISERDRQQAGLRSVFHGPGNEVMERLLREDYDIHNADPKFEKHGVHVFLDMSNIHISFLRTIKQELGLNQTARFLRNPRLDLDHLTKFITRGRRVKTQNAGCSVMPDRPEPAHIEELRQLSYRVDVRERRPTQEPKKYGGYGPFLSSSPNDVRYVEDLVDETLQTRIGETFMRYGQKKSTLILVTGDAQPAPYADGFYKCATRALKWGWNVEVVCWGASCSSLWTDLAEAEGDDYRFRLLKLDNLIGDLWMES